MALPLIIPLTISLPLLIIIPIKALSIKALLPLKVLLPLKIPTTKITYRRASSISTFVFSTLISRDNRN